MAAIDRTNRYDAQKQMEKFIRDEQTRLAVSSHLAEMIIHAHGKNPGNWNLNLDKSGKVIRFNVGQEYCIEIQNNILILCLRSILKRAIQGKDLNIVFVGYDKQSPVRSTELEGLPDSLAFVPGSVGCEIDYEDFETCLPFLRKANQEFIEVAIQKTTIFKQMKNAHSPGAIDYIAELTGKKIPNPFYAHIDEKEFLQEEEKLLSKAKKMSDAELEEKVMKAGALPAHIETVRKNYYRNPYLVEYIKRKANGICQDCGNPAPFICINTNEPYLEVHHITPLSRGGEDSADNMLALCPNCHRKRHHGMAVEIKSDTG